MKVRVYGTVHKRYMYMYVYIINNVFQEPETDNPTLSISYLVSPVSCKRCDLTISEYYDLDFLHVSAIPSAPCLLIMLLA